jgi:hypothetical protein
MTLHLRRSPHTIDADGAGIGAGVTIATPLDVTLAQSNTDNYLV